MSAQAGPLVSIILPVLNAARFLGQALASVAAQTYAHYEIVAVDGGSSDETPAMLAAAPRTRCLRQTGMGLPAAWNTGLAAAQGESICFLDSDDLWPADRLARQVSYLAQHPQALYVLGHVQLFLEPGCPQPVSLAQAAFEGSHLGHMPGTLLAWRELFDRLGGFETQWRIASDIEWFARLGDAALPGAELPEVVLYRRIHETNLSQRAGQQLIQDELLRVFKQRLDRRRAAARPHPGP